MFFLTQHNHTYTGVCLIFLHMKIALTHNFITILQSNNHPTYKCSRIHMRVLKKITVLPQLMIPRNHNKLLLHKQSKTHLNLLKQGRIFATIKKIHQIQIICEINIHNYMYIHMHINNQHAKIGHIHTEYLQNQNAINQLYLHVILCAIKLKIYHYYKN